ncbi:MAG: hypothetical protein H6579_03025 [Chitinophagales bacterium]|nr:hypothetical protein [Chitinophagales bacterium]
MRIILILCLLPIFGLSQEKGFHIPDSNEYVCVVEKGANYVIKNEDIDRFAESFFLTDFEGRLKYAISIYKVMLDDYSGSYNEKVETFYLNDCKDCSINLSYPEKFCNIEGMVWEYEKVQDGLELKGYNFYTKGTYSDYAIIFICLKDDFNLYKNAYLEFLNKMIIL